MTTTPAPGHLVALSDSYGGIVGALNELRRRQGLAYKYYESNFAGIVEAIRDLSILGNADYGELPPGWEVDEDGNGEWQYTPESGSLWFDARQGRLFVYMDDGYYQTNGQDGLTFVGTSPPTDEVVGGQWYNPDTGGLYVYDGNAWNLIDMAGTLTAEDMHLNTITDTFASALSGPTITAFSNGGAVATQGSYNRWVARSLIELETALETESSISTVYAGDTAPSSSSEGDLWFDTTDLNLYVYYVDNDSGQWVPGFNTLQDNAEFNALQTSLSNLSGNTTLQYNQLGTRIDNLPFSDYALSTDVTNVQTTLQGSIDALTATVGDLNRFASVSTLASSVQTINDRIDTVAAQETDISSLATITELSNAVSALNASITSVNTTASTYADQKAAEVTALIPDISGKADTADLQAFITTAAQSYFPRLGGVLNGTFGMQKTDIGIPSFDFSSAHYYGNKVFKFKTNSISEQYVEFGTNSLPWEYAWQFGSNEDFCWKHTDAGKVFSIDEDGPACEKLTIGQFSVNNGGGRRLSNKIEVGEMLRSHQDVLEDIRNAATLSTDFDSFKIRLLEALAPV